jgi:hypothetical protein
MLLRRAILQKFTGWMFSFAPSLHFFAWHRLFGVAHSDGAAMNAHLDTYPAQDDAAIKRDAALEKEIDAACTRMCDPTASEWESRAAWADMSRLIFRRSPHRILKMEIERRIAHKATFEPRDGKGMI